PQEGGVPITLEQVHVGVASIGWYEGSAGAERIAQLRTLADALRGVRILHINAKRRSPNSGRRRRALGRGTAPGALCQVHVAQSDGPERHLHDGHHQYTPRNSRDSGTTGNEHTSW